MSLLTVANLCYSLGERQLLDGVNLTVGYGEHVGLVGRNGCGKSTLLKMIASIGPFKPDTGQIQLTGGASVGYLTQDPDLDPEKTLREEAGTAFAELNMLHEQLNDISHQMADAQDQKLQKLLEKYGEVEHRIQTLGGYAVDHKIDATLHGLGLDDSLFNVPVKSLSGGQRGRLALAKLLLNEPQVLLLDEPTNHLDIAGREWLEEYLKQYTGAVVLISHDRWLLDRVVTKIYELHNGQMEEYPGNYQDFRRQRLERRLAQKRQFDLQQEYIKKEQGFIDRYRAGQRAAQAQGREKRLERLKRDDMLDRPVEFDEVNIRIAPHQRCGDLVVNVDNITKAYGPRVLFKHFTFVLKRGEKVGIIGPNGAGKSTLVKAMMGELEIDQGQVRVGASVDVGYYRQTHDHLKLDQTILDLLRPYTPGQLEQEARDLAGAFLFSGRDQEKLLSVLSGGERSRAVLATLIVGGHNLLVFDEPTNHLDIPSAERLEDALREYTKEPKGFGSNNSGGGSLILITHDRMLLEDLVDQLLILDGHGNVRHFMGKYSDYVKLMKESIANSQPAPSSPAPSAARSGDQKSKDKDKKKEQPKSKPAGDPKLAKLSQESLEARIVDTESKLADLDQQLANPDIYRDGGKVKTLQEKRDKLKAELTPLEAEWARRAQ